MGISRFVGSIFIRSLILFLILTTLASCEHEKGFGGNSSISGKIIMREYNMDQSLLLR